MESRQGIKTELDDMISTIQNATQSSKSTMETYGKKKKLSVRKRN